MADNTTLLDKESIFNEIKNIMQELFDLDKDDIHLESRLYQDLDIDSIDAIDMMAALKKVTGKKIQATAFKTVRTVGDIVDTVHDLLSSD